MGIVTLDDVWVQRNPKINGTRVTYRVRVGESVDELWFESPNTSPNDLAYERADSAIVAMLPLLIRHGFDHFKSNLPLSEKLYYNLTYHLIPQLVTSDPRSRGELEISAPLTRQAFAGRGVSTGMSLGIDSFATFSEYSRSIQLPNYRITHFTYFNIGAHHGRDAELGRSTLTSRELFEGQRERVREFCEAHGYPLLEVDSNLPRFLRRTFGRTSFLRSHTYRNAAAALLLQKQIGTYYYSSAFNLDLFKASLKVDSARYEKWLLPLLSNESMEFYNSNRQWRRIDKTRIVSELPESYGHLTVCLVGVDNCGRCMKCRKTLMALDVLGNGAIERYHRVFDLDKYMNYSRHEWFGSIHARMAEPGLPGQDMKDIFSEGRKNGYPHLPDEN